MNNKIAATHEEIGSLNSMTAMLYQELCSIRSDVGTVISSVTQQEGSCIISHMSIISK
jgi:hypothetical protein